MQEDPNAETLIGLNSSLILMETKYSHNFKGTQRQVQTEVVENLQVNRNGAAQIMGKQQ